jgi:hypothetical protein
MALWSFQGWPAGRPVAGPSLKRPYGCFRGGTPAGWVACGRLLPPLTPHAIRLWLKEAENEFNAAERKRNEADDEVQKLKRCLKELDDQKETLQLSLDCIQGRRQHQVD